MLIGILVTMLLPEDTSTMRAQLERRAELQKQEIMRLQRQLAKTTTEMKELAYVAHLSPEVLSEIFRFYRLGHRMDYEAERSYAWLAITQVCRFWREVALSTPHIWTWITLNQANCVQELLLRSKRLPLYVESATTRSQHDTRSLVLAMRELPRVAHIELSFRKDTFNFRHLQRIRPQDALLLTHLSIDSESSPNVTIPDVSFLVSQFKTVPRLEVLDLTGILLRSTTPFLVPSLRKLVLCYVPERPSATGLLNILDTLKALEELVLSNTISHSGPDLPVVGVPIATLPQLRFFMLTETDPGTESMTFTDHVEMHPDATVVVNWDPSVTISHLRPLIRHVVSRTAGKGYTGSVALPSSVRVHIRGDSVANLDIWRTTRPIDFIARARRLVSEPSGSDPAFNVHLIGHDLGLFTLELCFALAPIPITKLCVLANSPSQSSTHLWLHAFVALVNVKELRLHRGLYCSPSESSTDPFP